MKNLTSKKFFAFALLVLFTLGSLLISPPATYALPSTQTDSLDSKNINCYSLDVVFLIDQSQSMSIKTNVGPASDAIGLRKSAVDWVINWLGDNVLAYCPDAFHRIGVVSWGSRAKTRIDASELIAPRTMNEWVEKRDVIKNLVVLYNQDNALGNTNPFIAFEKAKEILDQFASEPFGDHPRKRVVVFLTDGVPYYDGMPSPITEVARTLIEQIKSDFPFDPTLLQQENCLSQALEKARLNDRKNISPEDKNNCLSSYPVNGLSYANSVYIWSILLNANADKGQPYETYRSFYDAMSQVSSSHAGYITSIVNSTDIPVKFLDIMTTLSGVKAERLGCQSFAMEPYLQQATLSFFKIDKDLTVEISYKKNGQTYSITQADLINNTTWPKEINGFTIKDYTSDNTIERYVFLRPYAGFWNIRAPLTADCKGIQAFFEPLDINLELISPLSIVPQYDLKPFYDQSSPVFIEYQLVNRGTDQELMGTDQELMGTDTQYPLTMSAKIKLVDGNEKDINLTYDLIRKTFRSDEPLNVSIVGSYEFSVKATTAYVNTSISEKRVLFIDGPRFFEVTPVTPFNIAITEPDQDDQILPLHSSLSNGLAVNPIKFRVILTERDGTKIDPAAILVNPNDTLMGTVTSSKLASPISVPLALDNEIQDEFVGVLSNLAEEGDYHLAVTIIETPEEKPYIDKYYPDNRIVEVDFVVRDGIWNRPATYKALAIALLILIIIIIIIIALKRNNPVTGTLVFEVGTTHIADIQIGTGWNVSKIARGTLQAYSSLGLKSLKAKKSKEQFGCVDYYAVDMNGASYEGTLMPKSPTPFAGGMMVRYEPL